MRPSNSTTKIILRNGRRTEISLSVCISAIHVTVLREIFVHVTDDHDSVLLYGGVAIRYVLSVLWMTSFLSIMGAMEQAT